MEGKRLPVLLVVEDDVAVRELYEKALADSYEVVSLSFGEGTPEITESYKPDLVLLDVNLPGVSGFEVCKRIRALPATKDVPVLFLTSLTDDASFHEGLKAGGTFWMTKPVSIPKLKERLAYMLKGNAS